MGKEDDVKYTTSSKVYNPRTASGLSYREDISQNAGRQ